MDSNHVDNIALVQRSQDEIRKCQSESVEKVGSIGIIMLVKSTRGNAPPRGIWQRVGALASASAKSDLARVSLSLYPLLSQIQQQKYWRYSDSSYFLVRQLTAATVTVAYVFSFYKQTSSVGDLLKVAFEKPTRRNGCVYVITRMRGSF